MKRTLGIWMFALFFLGVFFFVPFVLGLPNGGILTPGSNDTAPSDTAGSHAAIAGNVTELVVTGYTTTQTWQGYYGNVSGAIRLADSTGNVLYNWSQTTATGEVFASINSSIGWPTISCFDMTERLTTEESAYGLGASDVDGIDETFSLNDHADFEVGSVSFTSGQCNNTKVFGPGGAATFDEILLDDSSNRTVFASLLADDTTGFDSLSHDFEMLVLENGHSGNTATTTYYFYVELG